MASSQVPRDIANHRNKIDHLQHEIERIKGHMSSRKIYLHSLETALGIESQRLQKAEDMVSASKLPHVSWAIMF